MPQKASEHRRLPPPKTAANSRSVRPPRPKRLPPSCRPKLSSATARRTCPRRSARCVPPMLQPELPASRKAAASHPRQPSHHPPAAAALLTPASPGEGPSRGAECRAAADPAEPSRAEPTGPLRPGAGGRRRPSAAASLDQTQRRGAATRPAARAGARRQSRQPSRAEGRPRGPLRLRARAARPGQLIQRARRRTNESSPCSRGTWPRESNSRGTLESSRARG
jgi:hypothetical protein